MRPNPMKVFSISITLATLVAISNLTALAAFGKPAPKNWVCSNSSWGRLSAPIKQTPKGLSYVTLELSVETTGGKSVLAYYGNKVVDANTERDLNVILKRSRGFVKGCKSI
jgi:hypothetical protein